MTRFHTSVAPAVRASNSSDRSAPSAVDTLSTVSTGRPIAEDHSRLLEPRHFERGSPLWHPPLITLLWQAHRGISREWAEEIVSSTPDQCCRGGDYPRRVRSVSWERIVSTAASPSSEIVPPTITILPEPNSSMTTSGSSSR